MGLVDDALKANEYVSEARKVFDKVKLLEKGQETISEALRALDNRVRDIEVDLRVTKREMDADLRVVKSEAAREAGSEARNAVNSVQSALYEKIIEISVEVDRLKRLMSEQQSIPSLPPPK